MFSAASRVLSTLSFHPLTLFSFWRESGNVSSAASRVLSTLSFHPLTLFSFWRENGNVSSAASRVPYTLSFHPLTLFSFWRESGNVSSAASRVPTTLSDVVAVQIPRIMIEGIASLFGRLNRGGDEIAIVGRDSINSHEGEGLRATPSRRNRDAHPKTSGENTPKARIESPDSRESSSAKQKH